MNASNKEYANVSRSGRMADRSRGQGVVHEIKTYVAGAEGGATGELGIKGGYSHLSTTRLRWKNRSSSLTATRNSTCSPVTR